MASSSLDICNISLNGHLGAAKLAALDTTTENGRKYSLLYAEALRELLREIRPNFAKKRAIFHQVVDSEKTITGATAANPVVITSALHGFSDGDQIAIYDVVGMTDLNGKMFLVADSDTNTFSLTDLNGSAIDGSDYDAYVSGGKCGVVSDSPAYGFNYRYALPSDYVLMLELDGNESLTLAHSIEGGEILTDETSLKGRYIYAVTNVALFDQDFIKVLVYKLNAELAFAVTGQTAIADKWEKKYLDELQKAKGRKSQESGSPGAGGPPRVMVANKWTNSRSGGS